MVAGMWKLNGETLGDTDANGQLIIAISADIEKLELEARLDDAKGELEIEFEAQAEVSATATTPQTQDASPRVTGLLHSPLKA